MKIHHFFHYILMRGTSITSRINISLIQKHTMLHLNDLVELFHTCSKFLNYNFGAIEH